MPADPLATLRDEIERRAYAHFCERGCVDGSDIDDWLAAERDVLTAQDRSINGRDPSPIVRTPRRRPPARER
jgi:hypothetical protein